MKKTKVSAIVSAMIMTAVTAFSPLYTCAENSAVYEDFNENDVNGTITVSIPENTTANIKITFTSPEVTDEPYYISSLTGGSSRSFDIEGRDTTEDDYRNYTLSVSVTGGKYKDTITYTDTFTVPDGNDNPDSFMKCEYNFTADDKYSGKNWDITSENASQKNITVHFGDYVKGDVDNDGFINAVDATTVLMEYAVRSTGGESTLSERQQLSANVNNDGFIDAVDATRILIYYASLSTGGNPSWENNGNSTSGTATTADTASTSPTATTAVPETQAVDYSSYKQSIQMLSTQTGILSAHSYYIYDINSDGVYELITKMGSGESDNKYSVYSMKNGEMIFAGEIEAGYSTLVEKDGKLYRDYRQKAQQTVELISFDGKKIFFETVYSEDSEVFTDYGTAIDSYDWSDISGIENIGKNTVSVTTASTAQTTTTTTTQTSAITTDTGNNGSSTPSLGNVDYSIANNND